MIRDHKKTLILASLATLLPIPVGMLLWDRFPAVITTHWGFDGQADGWGSVPFTVFIPPVIMLAVFWLCIWVTVKDPGNQGRNKKPLTMVFWIIPVLSNLCSGMMYALALGAEFSVTNVMVGFMGILFAIIGNYMPKCRMNSTIGIKIPWTYSSEANWNATHRFAGRVWFIGGIALLLSAILPPQVGIAVMLADIIVIIAVPTVYSYHFYKKEKAQGKAQIPALFPRDAKNQKFAYLAVVLILIILAVIMFSGSIDVQFGQESFTIDATYYDSLTVEYAAIDSIEYRDGNIRGTRAAGFSNARLLLGWFENEEFGIYMRYTYIKPEACIVLTVEDRTLVISGIDIAETQAIYQTLTTKIS